MGEAGAPDLKPAGARAPRPWSLARRLTTHFLISTSLFVVAISALSAWQLEQAVDKEVAGLAAEELDELQNMLERDAPAPDSKTPREEIESRWPKSERIESFVQNQSAQHSDYHFAFLVWRPGAELDTPAWGRFGDVVNVLTPDVPDGWPKTASSRLPRGRLLSARQTKPSAWHVLMVLDASRRYAAQRLFLLSALLLIFASMVVVLVYSRFFFARVSRLLGQVATRAREVRSIEEPLGIEVENAPIEIAAIAEALSEMLEKVRRETDQARIFTAGLAHELRSPVQNLVGETEVALLRPREASVYRKVLASNLEELRSLGDAVDNLVTICSAGEVGRAHPRELINLGEEAQIRLARERTQGQRHEVELELSVEGDTRIWCDREALLRAIRNLVANAIQWSPPKSKVVALVRGLPQEIEVVVEDAGPGIPPELHLRIFEPFFRGPQAAGRRIGYGLGLALTRMAVDEHAGRIEVGESKLGGARFRVVLPRRAPDPEGSADKDTVLTS